MIYCPKCFGWPPNLRPGRVGLDLKVDLKAVVLSNLSRLLCYKLSFRQSSATFSSCWWALHAQMPYSISFLCVYLGFSSFYATEIVLCSQVGDGAERRYGTVVCRSREVLALLKIVKLFLWPQVDVSVRKHI